ncbi:unnamed protein product [Gadus morhua 'NCC']
MEQRSKDDSRMLPWNSLSRIFRVAAAAAAEVEAAEAELWQVALWERMCVCMPANRKAFNVEQARGPLRRNPLVWTGRDGQAKKASRIEKREKTDKDEERIWILHMNLNQNHNSGPHYATGPGVRQAQV